jgi:hypothetical protein
MAVQHDHVDSVKCLLEREYFSATDVLCAIPLLSCGATLLHMAAMAGANKVIQVLVEHGCDINAVDKSGQTPLHAATWSKKDDTTVSALMKAGASLDVLDNNGMKR